MGFIEFCQSLHSFQIYCFHESEQKKVMILLDSLYSMYYFSLLLQFMLNYEQKKDINPKRCQRQEEKNSFEISPNVTSVVLHHLGMGCGPPSVG